MSPGSSHCGRKPACLQTPRTEVISHLIMRPLVPPLLVLTSAREDVAAKVVEALRPCVHPKEGARTPGIFSARREFCLGPACPLECPVTGALLHKLL
jgi:hypothetical protein